MKNLFIIAVFMIAALTVSATPKVTDYIVTQNGVEYFKKVKTNSTKYIVGVMSDGTRVMHLKESVKAYRQNGAIFENTGNVKNNEVFKNCQFLELLNTKCDCKVYRYYKVDSQGDLVSEIIVYSNDKFVTVVTQENVAQILSFFKK